MPSVVDICNKALDKLGHGPITSLDDGTKAANLCNRNWEMVRDEVLREHPWNFAIKRTVLAASTEAPAWGFSNKFTLPADNLRVIEVRDMSTGDYQVEDGAILADEEALYIRYIYKVADPNRYDTHFVDCVSDRLAYELCEALTQKSTNERQFFLTVYQESLVAAKRTDGQENPPQQFEEDDWISVRY